jgi:BirA family biotin operon repressor/biotin-[acetyl-CoA-carboxylase] ligase
MKIHLFKNIHIYEEVSSTSDVAKDLINKYDENFLIIAKNQSSGYGRKGNFWHSPKGGIWMTAGLKSLKISSNFTLFTGIVLHKTLTRIYPNIDFKIKWPNDIYADNKKIAGIISSSHPNQDFHLFGIGINSNVKEIHPSLKEKASSLYLESGSMVSNNLIIEKIWDTFEKELPNFLKNDFGFYREYFLKNSLLMNEKIKVKQIQNIIEGKVVDISNSGELILKTDDSRLININSGEIIFKNV